MFENRSRIMREKERWKTLLAKRMTPEERLVALFNHSQLLYQIYQAGVDYRASFSLATKKTRS